MKPRCPLCHRVRSGRKVLRKAEAVQVRVAKVRPARSGARMPRYDIIGLVPAGFLQSGGGAGER